MTMMMDDADNDKPDDDDDGGDDDDDDDDDYDDDDAHMFYHSSEATLISHNLKNDNQGNRLYLRYSFNRIYLVFFQQGIIELCVCGLWLCWGVWGVWGADHPIMPSDELNR